MGKEGDWYDKNVDLKKLAQTIQQFFYDDGFSEVRMDEDQNRTWFEIQARKKGVLRTVGSSRKAIHVIVKGSPNKFNVSIGTGEWGKKFAVAALFTGGIGLIGMGLNVRFHNKLWNFIKNSVVKLENSATLTEEKKPTDTPDPLTILKQRLALGEITKKEYEDLKKALI